VRCFWPKKQAFLAFSVLFLRQHTMSKMGFCAEISGKRGVSRRHRGWYFFVFLGVWRTHLSPKGLAIFFPLAFENGRFFFFWAGTSKFFEWFRRVAEIKFWPSHTSGIDSKLIFDENSFITRYKKSCAWKPIRVPPRSGFFLKCCSYMVFPTEGNPTFFLSKMWNFFVCLYPPKNQCWNRYSIISQIYQKIP